MPDWLEKLFTKSGLKGFHSGGVVSRAHLKDNEFPVVLSQGSRVPMRPSQADKFPCPAHHMYRKDSAPPITVTVTAPQHDKLDAVLHAKQMIAQSMGRSMTPYEEGLLDQAVNGMGPDRNVTAEELRGILEAQPDWDKTGDPRQDLYPTPKMSAALMETVARTSIHDIMKDVLVPRMHGQRLSLGASGSYGGITVVPVAPGTEIRRGDQVEKVTESQAVHDGNIVYVTPAQYERVKAESKGNSK